MSKRYLPVIMFTILLGFVHADDLRQKYVGKSSCSTELWGRVGNYGIRLDKTQNAYLAAHTLNGERILLIVQYKAEGYKCGTIKDIIHSRDTKSYFEVECTDKHDPLAVVVGTWPETNNARRGTAIEAWQVDLRELKFVPLQRRATCIRTGYEGSDQGEDLVTLAKQRKKQTSKATRKVKD